MLGEFFRGVLDRRRRERWVSVGSMNDPGFGVETCTDVTRRDVPSKKKDWSRTVETELTRVHAQSGLNTSCLVEHKWRRLVGMSSRKRSVTPGVCIPPRTVYSLSF